MTLGQRGIALLLTFILAALLGPGDFGTVAMAMAYILFIEMFVAQGMAAAIIQRKELGDDHLDAVFWLTLAAGIVLACLSVALSGWWAAVNDLPMLAPVIAVLSLSIPIKGMTVVQQALLQRKMDFRTLALLGGASSIAGGGAGVAMAVLGCGVWSLVAQQLITSALATAIMWAVSDWRPRLRFSFPHARALLGFSGGVFASQLGVYLAAQCDAILMGIFFGPVAFGLFRLADRLMRTLLEVATRSLQIVSLPHFSRHQDNPEGLRSAALSCIRSSATITIPAMAVLAVVSDPLMAVVGEEWAPAADVLKIVVIMGAVKAITLFNGPMVFAKSRPHAYAILVWILALTTAAGLVLLGVLMRRAAIEHQIMAAAAMRVAVFAFFFGAPSLIIASRICDLPVRRCLQAAMPAAGAAVAVITASLVMSATGLLQSAPAVPALLLATAIAALAAGIGLLAFDRTVRRAAFRVLRLALHRFAPPLRALPTQPD
jgi:PST family polysaccharide transporter